MSYYQPSDHDSFQPDIEIDLHGMSAIECKMTLEEIIDSGVYNRVRLIVGKGTRSDYGPVLPAVVKNMLSERGIGFADAPLCAGGAGAIDATLS